MAESKKAAVPVIEKANWYKDNYKPSGDEANDVHLVVEQVEYNSFGKKVSKPQKVIKDARRFQNEIQKTGVFPYGSLHALGFTIIRVLHIPDGVKFNLKEHYQGEKDILAMIENLTK